MFESAEIGHAIDKKTYEAELPACARRCWKSSTSCARRRSSR